MIDIDSPANDSPTDDPATHGSPAEDRHLPVLVDRVTDLIGPAVQERAEAPHIHVDATLGMGGHAVAVLEAYPEVQVIGIDRDPHALELAEQRLRRFSDRVTLVHAVYDEVETAMAEIAADGIDSILFDLGVSSLHLDEAARGFAYRWDGPLDMRMNPGDDLTAADVVNTYSELDLTRTLRTYGEEKYARQIARRIVRVREETPIRTSSALIEVLERSIPAASRQSGGHPAKRTFQALRIEVNDELRIWERALPAWLEHVVVGGRAVVLSYHSLEDRITKQVFAAGATSSAPHGLPVEMPEHRPWLELLTRGAERASGDEAERNPRAIPVRLRAAQRTRTTTGDGDPNREGPR